MRIMNAKYKITDVSNWLIWTGLSKKVFRMFEVVLAGSWLTVIVDFWQNIIVAYRNLDYVRSKISKFSSFKPSQS